MDVKILLNPVRLRIFQNILIKKEATVDEMAKDLTDVPRASLYRHIKKLLDAGYIKIANETPVRGTVLKSYSIAEQNSQNDDNKELLKSISMLLFSLFTDFKTYFADENADPMKDLICVRTATFMLTDEEMKNMFMEIAKVYEKNINNEVTADRKQRKITLITSPIIDDEE